MIPNWSSFSYESDEYLTGEVKVLSSDNGRDININGAFPHPRPRDLTSGNKKVLMAVHGSYFHLLTEMVPVVLREMELSSNPLEFYFLIFDNNFQVKLTHIEHVIAYLIEQIKKKGHSAALLSLDAGVGEPVFIDNFVIISNPQPSLKYLKAVSDFLMDGIDIPQHPSRKIYLSRGKTLSNFDSNDKVYYLDKDMSVSDVYEKHKYSNKARIDDEQLVEDYMRGLGYEVVYPEELTSFKAQLEMMANTRTIASVTGAGMTSLIFMRSGGKVIEFMIPLINPSQPGGEGLPLESIHPHYFHLSYERKHAYTAVPHERVASKLLESIETTPGLKDYIAN